MSSEQMYWWFDEVFENGCFLSSIQSNRNKWTSNRSSLALEMVFNYCKYKFTYLFRKYLVLNVCRQIHVTFFNGLSVTSAFQPSDSYFLQKLQTLISHIKCRLGQCFNLTSQLGYFKCNLMLEISGSIYPLKIIQILRFYLEKKT